MKIYRRYSYVLIGSGLAFCAVLVALAFWLDPLWGDLTRLGWLPESLYGNNRPEQVVREKRYDKDTYERYYHLVVIGDSFSHAGGDKTSDLRVWQNHFQLQTNWQITTFHADQQDWRKVVDLPMFKSAPPALFVYEIVERTLRHRLGQPPATACRDRRGVQALAQAPLPYAPVADRAGLLMDLPRPEQQIDSKQLTYARDYLAKQWRQWRGKFDSPVVRLPLNKPLFSSRRADQLLVIRDDLNKRDWSVSELEHISCNLRDMQRVVESNGRTRLVVMIVPDKLTAYADYIATPGYGGLGVIDRLAAAGRLPLARVDRALREAIAAGVEDVYAPDNTHLSSQGYVLLADALLQHLGQAGLAVPVGTPPAMPVGAP